MQAITSLVTMYFNSISLSLSLLSLRLQIKMVLRKKIYSRIPSRETWACNMDIHTYIIGHYKPSLLIKLNNCCTDFELIIHGMQAITSLVTMYFNSLSLSLTPLSQTSNNAGFEKKNLQQNSK